MKCKNLKMTSLSYITYKPAWATLLFNIYPPQLAQWRSAPPHSRPLSQHKLGKNHGSTKIFSCTFFQNIYMQIKLFYSLQSTGTCLFQEGSNLTSRAEGPSPMPRGPGLNVTPRGAIINARGPNAMPRGAIINA